MECCASLASRTQRWPPGATLVSPNARRAWTARAVRPAPPTTISTREGAGCSVPTRPTCCSGSVCVSEDGSQLACDQSCATCNLGTSQSCLTCAPGSLYTELYHTCTPACLHGFYIDEDTSCVPASNRRSWRRQAMFYYSSTCRVCSNYLRLPFLRLSPPIARNCPRLFA